MVEEIWKTIEEFPEYEVSSLGNIRSKDRDYEDTLGRKYHKKGQLIKTHQYINDTGYIQIMVEIVSNKKMHNLIVSRLVAKAFIDNPYNYPQVNHIDEDSTNNNADNLEWCDCKYNINYKDLVKRRSEKRSRAVKIYDNKNNYIETLPSCTVASKKYNVSLTMISNCCNNKIKSAKGYYFEFA